MHEHGHYSSLDGFLDLVVPFVEEGLAAAEPLLVAGDDEQRAALTRAVGRPPGLELLTLDGTFERPATTIKAYRRLVAERAVAGRRVRSAGTLRPGGSSGPAASWDSWVRYEAALNHVMADLPFHAFCLYDTAATPADVLDDLEATYPYRRDAGGSSSNPRFADPVTFLHERRRAAPSPLEQGEPAVELRSPSARTARLAVGALAGTTGLGHDTLDDLLVGVSESVANASTHGVPPVVVRAWADADRVVVTVTDRGAGPPDAFAGFVPAARPGAGGLGLWITHQLCADVTLSQGPEGFTIRLVAGALGAR